METISSGLMTNFINTAIINLNVQVLINLFLYSTAVTSGVLASSKIITLLFEEFLKFFRFRLETKYKNKIEEIRELNRKMHDRLVEIEEAIRSDQYLNNKTRKRLLYNASRITKYDKTIIDDVYSLLNNWETSLFLNEKKQLNSGELSKEKTTCINLSKKIKTKIDKLLV